MSDSFYFNEHILLPLTGSNASTTLTDYTTPAKTVTCVGNAQISTAQSKFGGGSLYLDGTGDYITFNNWSNVNDSTADTNNFTIEFWMRPQRVNAGQILFSSYWGAGTTKIGIQINMQSGTPTKLTMQAGDNNSTVWEVNATGATTLVVDTWYHVAMVRNGSNFSLYLNGTLEATATYSGGVYLAGSSNNSFKSQFGGDATGLSPFQGYVNDFRITNFFALYTANFTPPGALDLTSPGVVPILLTAATPLVQLGFGGVAPKSLTPIAELYDVNFGGTGRVSGTTKVKGTPNFAVHRRVRLHRERDGLIVREQWSDPVTGAYSFDNIDANQKYTVVTHDYEHSFRAVIADNITPDPMP